MHTEAGSVSHVVSSRHCYWLAAGLPAGRRALAAPPHPTAPALAPAEPGRGPQHPHPLLPLPAAGEKAGRTTKVRYCQNQSDKPPGLLPVHDSARAGHEGHAPVQAAASAGATASACASVADLSVHCQRLHSRLQQGKAAGQQAGGTGARGFAGPRPTHVCSRPGSQGEGRRMGCS